MGRYRWRVEDDGASARIGRRGFILSPGGGNGRTCAARRSRIGMLLFSHPGARISPSFVSPRYSRLLLSRTRSPVDRCAPGGPRDAIETSNASCIAGAGCLLRPGRASRARVGWIGVLCGRERTFGSVRSSSRLKCRLETRSQGGHQRANPAPPQGRRALAMASCQREGSAPDLRARPWAWAGRSILARRGRTRRAAGSSRGPHPDLLFSLIRGRVRQPRRPATRASQAFGPVLDCQTCGATSAPTST
jgi:hypothetical protein